MGTLTKRKNGIYLIPAVLSGIIPGLGQLLKGHFVKAIVVYVAVFVIVKLFGWLPLIGWAVAAIAWLANVLDAAFSNSAD